MITRDIKMDTLEALHRHILDLIQTNNLSIQSMLEFECITIRKPGYDLTSTDGWVKARFELIRITTRWMMRHRTNEVDQVDQIAWEDPEMLTKLEVWLMAMHSL
jgi:hypothetical protein